MDRVFPLKSLCVLNILCVVKIFLLCVFAEKSVCLPNFLPGTVSLLLTVSVLKSAARQLFTA